MSGTTLNLEIHISYYADQNIKQVKMTDMPLQMQSFIPCIIQSFCFI